MKNKITKQWMIFLIDDSKMQVGIMQSTLPGFIFGFATRKWYTNRYETIQLSSASDKHARKRGNNITRRRCFAYILIESI